jgi:hypothetical protein
MQMRTTKHTPPVVVYLVALNTQTNRVERMVLVGRVKAPATARATLEATRTAVEKEKTRITF